jgi:hypothetical protein
MGNEQMARTWQNQQTAQNNAVARVEASLANDVQEGVKKALTTNTPNPFAMTFVGQDKQGKTVVAPYVRKAGRSVMLNEAAKKKGGLASMKSTCIRSFRETKEDLVAALGALPPSLQEKFMDARQNDMRCLTLPNGMALYKFTILFKNGEKWEGEGLAHRDNTGPLVQARLDEMAETRAFMRCVGRALADGFINPDQIAGNENWTDAEAELLAEDQEADEDFITLEADPDGSGTFLVSDDLGEGGPGEGEGGTAATPQARHGQADRGDGAHGAPDDESLRFGGGSVGGGSSGGGASGAEGGHYASQAPSVDELMGIARKLNVHLVTVAKERYGKGLGQLTPEQRQKLWDDLMEQQLAKETASS